MNVQRGSSPDLGTLGELLRQLREAGETPDRTLMEQIKAFRTDVVPPLIEMAVDENLRLVGESGPEGWSPFHADRLLGELGAREAIIPLLSLLEIENEWFDRSKDLSVRARAAEGLTRVEDYHPAARSDAIDILVARLDARESQTPDDETVNAFVICGLLDLKAIEALPAMRQALDEDRVDPQVVGLESVLHELGLPPEPASSEPRPPSGRVLPLRFTSCGYVRPHDVGTVYVHAPTRDRRERGEPVPYSEYVLTRRITCPKCGAVDTYEFASEAHLALIAELIRLQLPASARAQLGANANREPGVVLIRDALGDGRDIHPRVALTTYREQVAAEPNRADKRVLYANALRFLGYRDEASDQYRQALQVDPANLGAYLGLGHLAREAGDLDEARRQYDLVRELAPSSNLQRTTKERILRDAQRALDVPEPALPAPGFGRFPPPFPHARPQPPTPAPLVAPAANPHLDRPSAPKVGRNEPCPCGSGKKYKKCHGR